MVLWKSELIKKERAWGCSILSVFLQPLNWTMVVRAGLQQPYGTKEYPCRWKQSAVDDRTGSRWCLDLWWHDGTVPDALNCTCLTPFRWRQKHLQLIEARSLLPVASGNFFFLFFFSFWRLIYWEWEEGRWEESLKLTLCWAWSPIQG